MLNFKSIKEQQNDNQELTEIQTKIIEIKREIEATNMKYENSPIIRSKKEEMASLLKQEFKKYFQGHDFEIHTDNNTLVATYNYYQVRLKDCGDYIFIIDIEDDNISEVIQIVEAKENFNNESTAYEYSSKLEKLRSELESKKTTLENAKTILDNASKIEFVYNFKDKYHEYKTPNELFDSLDNPK
ncbi:hypothetical protein [Vallitalea guaymasensis]|uniref:hypothetical protein n=1 Tax=Vallitalea guaymasensis TaxID=1185412 RepID=UPI002356617F|nr:hypothetical protein [Vallitalea guaymasensis]